MSAISARVLDLLAMLQARRHWTGEELARRLEVSPRTLRRDVASLQGLGYPITTTRGTGGGYQLSPGGALPPLVLSQDEATAVVVALKEAATGSHPTEAAAAVSALAKIVQVLPSTIRRRIDSLQHLVTIPGPIGAPAAVDTATLTTCALAARDHEGITFFYTDAEGSTTHRHVEPHHVVSLDQRLYLVAYDLERAGWRNFRIDRAVDPERTRRTFAPRGLPVGDPAEFVRMQVVKARERHDVTASVQISAASAQRLLGEWGTASPIAENACTVHLPAGDLDWATFALVGLGAPFTLHGPEEAVSRVAAWGARLTAAVEPAAREESSINVPGRDT